MHIIENVVNCEHPEFFNSIFSRYKLILADLGYNDDEAYISLNTTYINMNLVLAFILMMDKMDLFTS